MTSETIRDYYPNGQLRSECPVTGDRLHGMVREWHENGTLKCERPMRHGLVDGIVRQWNRQGTLLGAYSMKDGTGIERLWNEHGVLTIESSKVRGGATGRQRIWDHDGTLLKTTYHIKNRTVLWKKYLQACESDPALPQYDAEEAAKSEITFSPEHFRRTKPLSADELAEADADDQDLDELRSSAGAIEATQWFATVPEGVERTVGDAHTTAESVEDLVELYSAVALAITLIDIHDYPADKTQNTGRLIVTMPQDPDARARVLAWCARWAQETGYDPTPDYGQRYVLVMMD